MSNELLDLAVKAALKAGKRILDVYGQDDFGVQHKADDSPLTLADRRAHEAIEGALASTGIPMLSEEGADIPYPTRSQWTHFWLVDPLDGTKEFIKRNGEFTVNIALIEDGHPCLGVIYVPVTDELYVGETGTGALKLKNAKSTATGNWRTQASPLPVHAGDRPLTVVGSRSHMNAETLEYVNSCVEQGGGHYEVISRGSSLKFCMVAEGRADLYPRFGPTMEWDTGAGHAIAEASGATVARADDGKPLRYNKEDLLNPFFIVKR